MVESLKQNVLSVDSGIAQMAVKQEQMCGRMTAMEEQTSSGTLPL